MGGTLFSALVRLLYILENSDIVLWYVAKHRLVFRHLEPCRHDSEV